MFRSRWWFARHSSGKGGYSARAVVMLVFAVVALMVGATAIGVALPDTGSAGGSSDGGPTTPPPGPQPDPPIDPDMVGDWAPATPVENRIVPKPETVVADSSTVSSVIGDPAVQQVVTLGPGAIVPEIDGFLAIDAGGAWPDGVLGRVRAVVPAPGTTAVTVSPARIDEAYEVFQINKILDLSEAFDHPPVPAVGGISARPVPVAGATNGFALNMFRCSNNSGLSINGSLTHAGVPLTVVFDPFQQYLRIKLDLSPTLRAELAARGAASCELDLPNTTVPAGGPFTAKIGPYLKIGFGTGVSLGATSTVTLSTGVEISGARARALYKKPTLSTDFTIDGDFDSTSSVGIGASVGPSLGGRVGIIIEAGPELEFRHTALTRCDELFAGVKIGAVVEVDVFVASWNAELASARIGFASQVRRCGVGPTTTSTSTPTTTTTPATTTTTPATTTHPPNGSQTIVPLRDVDTPYGVTFTPSGSIVVSQKFGKIVELSPNGQQRTLIDNELLQAWDVASDGAGNIYYDDLNTRQVLKLAPGATSPETLYTFPDSWQTPFAIAAGADGTVVVSAGIPNDTTWRMNVWKLSPGSHTPVMLPFPKEGYSALAVSTVGDIYAVGDETIWKLAPGSDVPTRLPVTQSSSRGMAVSSNGDVFYSTAFGPGPGLGAGTVSVLRNGAAAPETLGLTGLKEPGALDISGTGDLVLADVENNRVLRYRWP